jgi:AcrR family transcriptional regulator
MTGQAADNKTVSQARTPQLQRGKARVAALLAAGARVFAEKGYDAATMTQIAVEANASIGSLYQFFPTKVLLAEALHAQERAALIAMLDTLKDGAIKQSAPEMADRLFAMLADYLSQHPAFVTLADRRDVDKERKRAARGAMESRIAALLAQTRPPLPPGRPQVIAVIILELMKAAVAITANEGDSVQVAAVAELRLMLKTHLRLLCNNASRD